MKIKQTIYVTKYALTEEIKKHEAEINQDYPQLATMEGMWVGLYGEGKQWHRTLESAKKWAEQMRINKIASLKKSLSKMEGMDFSKVTN